MKKLGRVRGLWKIEKIKKNLKILHVKDTDRSIWVSWTIDLKVEIFDIFWHFDELNFTITGYFYFSFMKWSLLNDSSSSFKFFLSPPAFSCTSWILCPRLTRCHRTPGPKSRIDEPRNQKQESTYENHRWFIKLKNYWVHVRLQDCWRFDGHWIGAHENPTQHSIGQT